MAKEFDPLKTTRKAQNLLIKIIMLVVIMFIFYYFCTIVLIMLLTSPIWVYKVFEKLFIDSDFIWHFNIFYSYAKQYIEYWWQYKEVIMFDTYNYLLPKIIVSFVIPHIILFYLTYKHWGEIMEYQPIKKEASVFGDAHWASQKEIKRMGLRAKKGLLMGKDKKGYLITGDYQHVMLFAPTGAGKGVGFVIPNLLFWEESVICHDIKLENYELSSMWRSKHLKQQVYTWAPADQDGYSHCYNPMDFISTKHGQMVDDVQKLANLLLQKREFWENEARTLCVGVMLYLVADKSKVCSFGQVVRELRSDDFSYNMAVVLDTMGEKIHPVAYMNLAAFLQKAEKERSGVVSTLNSGLELWANPIIDTTTARSDFNIKEFKTKLTTAYVGLTPDNIQRLKPLVSMFYQQATEFLTQHTPRKDEPYGVLFLMDEFPTLGKLEQFLAGIAYFRGYHCRLFLIIQDTQQLKGTYEDAGMNAFLSNSMYRITFAANNIETAKLISELVGNQTVEATSYNKPRFFDLNPGSRSTNTSGSSRALLLPQEIISMDRDDQIILIEAAPPIRTQKIKYYQDKDFTKKLWGKTKLPKHEPIVHKPQPSKKPQQQDQQQEPPQQPQENSGGDNNANANSDANGGALPAE